MQQALDHLRAADPALAAAIDQIGAYSHQPGPHGFIALADAIVSQQISIQAAAAIWARLEAALGVVGPAEVLAADEGALRAAGLSAQKVRYLRDLAGRVAAGSLDLAGLARLDDEAAIAQLTAVTGIGRWTAEIYLIFALGRPDVLPADDLGLRDALRQLYDLPALPSARELRAHGERWRPYRSVASWYLWRGRRAGR